MPIDPVLLAKSIATLTDLDPERDLAATLEQAVAAAKKLFAVDAAGIMLAGADGKLRWASASDPLGQILEDNQEVLAAGPCMQAFVSGRPAVMHDAAVEPRWGEITLVFADLQIRSGLSVPVELGAGPIGTLDVYAVAPGGWDQTEVSALQTFAGLVATLLGTAAKAQRSGRLASQLQVALDARILMEETKGALEERERLLAEQAVVDLRRAEPAGTTGNRVPQPNVRASDGDVAALLEQEPGEVGIGQKLSQVLLSFLSIELVPLADRLAQLGIDPMPLLAAISDILRLYADTLVRPEPRR